MGDPTPGGWAYSQDDVNAFEAYFTTPGGTGIYTGYQGNQYSQTDFTTNAASPYTSNLTGSSFDTNSYEQANVAALWRWPGIGSQGDMTQESIKQAGMPLGQRRMNAVRPMSQTSLTMDPTYREGYRNTPSEHAEPLYGNIAMNVGAVALAIVIAVAFLQNFDK